MMWALAALFIASHLTCIHSHLNVTLSHLKFTGDPWKSDKVSVSCGIQEINQDSNDNISYEVIGYMILKSNQSHWKSIAELFKSDPNQAYVSDPSVVEATGSVKGDGRLSSHFKVTWTKFETSMYGKYRCEAIVKMTERKDENKSYYNLPFNWYGHKDQQARKKQFLTFSVDFVLTPIDKYSANDSTFDQFIKIEDANNNITLFVNKKNALNDTFLSGNLLNPQKASNDKDVLDFFKTVKTDHKENNSNKALTRDKDIGETHMGSHDPHFHKRHLLKRSLLSIPNSEDDKIKDFTDSMRSQNSYGVDKSITSNETTNNNSLINVKDHNVIQEDKMSEKLKNMTAQLRHFKKAMNQTFNLMTLINEHKDDYVQKLIYQLDQKLQTREKLFNNYSQEFMEFFNSFSKNVDTNADKMSVIRWPGGTYALLKSTSGCPLNPVKAQEWKEGYRRYHTESTSGYNSDSHSTDSHLALPINSTDNNQHFMTLHFCVKTDDDSDGAQWPKGSYCIHRKGNCPEGFIAGYFGIDEEDTDYKGVFSGIVPENGTQKFLLYCCRSDGSPLYPIQLPVFTPFYLYRHGGRCQNVLGMSVTEEYVYIDTENSRNEDSKQSPHPDGSINNINITLCYYNDKLQI